MKKNWINSPLIAAFGAFVIRAIAVTLRYEIEDNAHLLTSSPSKNYLFAFWHNRIFLFPYLHYKYFPKRPITVMISRSRDGQLITDIASRFGISAARGSTSKRSIHAYRQLLRKLMKEHKDVAVTPDGPRGPRYRVQPGIIRLAKMSGYPIIPVTYNLSRKIQLPSWDGFQIPIPFSKCLIKTHSPIEIPRELSDHLIKHFSARLTNTLLD